MSEDLTATSDARAASGNATGPGSDTLYGSAPFGALLNEILQSAQADFARHRDFDRGRR